MAANAAFEAEWLAALRLGETNAAIGQMENALSVQIQTLATWESVAPPDGQTRQARDRWLIGVKAYRQSYPAIPSEITGANELLSTIPTRKPDSSCKSAVCRLDDLRLARVRATTNSP
jgi:hypothetical protein